MRYYLDTNILIYFLYERESLQHDVFELIEDNSNLLYVSSIAVKELIHLYKSKKINTRLYKNAKDIIKAIEIASIEIVPVNKFHLLQYAELEIVPEHNDPNDHIIISQAISDKIPIISSDRTFKKYVGQGLQFIFNRR